MPLPFLMCEGQHIDHFGNLIWSSYVDFRFLAERQPIGRLVKGCREEHAIEISQQLLISKPSRFRSLGENLVRDPGEAYASQIETTLDEIDDPSHLAEARRRGQGREPSRRACGGFLDDQDNRCTEDLLQHKCIGLRKKRVDILHLHRTHYAN